MPEIDKVVIYGSRAKGTYKQGSDIDLALWFENDGNLAKISSELDELPTPYKFDILDYNKLTHENLKNSIDNEGKLFYEKSTEL